MKVRGILSFSAVVFILFILSSCGRESTTYETSLAYTNMFEPQQVQEVITPLSLMQEAQIAKAGLFNTAQKTYALLENGARNNYYLNYESLSSEEHSNIVRVEPRYIIALTFDDGPSRFTEHILDILERYNARATFCVLGNRVESRADIVLRTIAGGSEVIGHSWNHANLAQQNEYTIRNQISNTSAIIEAVTGFPPPPIFRAPYGSVNARVRNVSYDMGYALLNWTIDTMDWRFRDPYHIYNHIMEHALHGAIVLLHDIYESTAEAMELVVPALIERGFKLVTASELIAYVYGSIEPGIEYRGLRPGESPRIQDLQRRDYLE